MKKTSPSFKIDKKPIPLIFDLIEACKTDNLKKVQDIIKGDDFSSLGEMKNYHLHKSCITASKYNSKNVVDFLFPLILDNPQNPIFHIIENISKNDNLDFYKKHIHKNSKVISKITAGIFDIAKFNIDEKNNGNILSFILNDKNDHFLLVSLLTHSIDKESLIHFDIAMKRLEKVSFLEKGSETNKETVLRHIVLEKIMLDGEYIHEFDGSKNNSQHFIDKLMGLINLDDVMAYKSFYLNENIANRAYYNKSVDVVDNYIYPMKEKEYFKKFISSNAPSSPTKRKL